MTHIKVCGITNLADARYASGAGADFLGFIQHPESPRHIEPGLARDIIAWVYGSKSIGVFVDCPADEVNGICDRVGFDFVQLHGSETVAYCHTIDRPIIKAFKVWNHTEAAELEMAMEAYKDVAEYFLLDTGSATAAGGTGESFDWKVVEDIVVSRPFFLAGGLSPDNVAGAVDRVKPFGLDVSSGVEESPGIKDFGRIDTFIEQARGTVSNR